MEDLIFVRSQECLIKPDTKWWDGTGLNQTDHELPVDFEKTKKLETINAFREYARKLYDQDLANYTISRDKTRRSDSNWMRTVLKTGTTGDKISANSLLIQESPVHNLSALETLIGSVKLAKKRECILSMTAAKDLFVTVLLPPKRALRSFHEHPFEWLAELKDKSVRDKCLLVFYFESLLKMKYLSFINNLRDVFHDNLENTKYKVAATLFELMTANSFEQQKLLYETAVNKLGDPDYKVASKIVYHINNFLHKCPKMKMNLLLEIERLVSRSNISERAQYYGFCCMNQLMLTRHDTEVANRLLVVYFSFFKKFVKNKNIDSRMLNALLTGVNRAYKYAKMDHAEIDQNIDTLFRLVHVTSFNVSIQALMFLNQVMESRDDMVNRYFNALYKRMCDLELGRTTTKQTYFLNLLYNSVVKDESLPRVKAFSKRLLQICFSQNAPFVCGSFMLLSEILKTKKNLFQLDHASLTGNLIATNSKFDDDDDEEKFTDAKDVDSEQETEKEPAEKEEEETTAKSKSLKRKAESGSWNHKSNVIFKRHVKYEPNERNPLYCGADKTLTYELLLLSRHYHPTVVVFANKLMMENEPVEYTGDPMEDFTIMHFLDRFVYKNPKKNKNPTGENVVVAAKAGRGGAMKKSVFQPIKSIHQSNIKNMPINSKEYLKLDIKQIPEEEKFFYNYYKSQQSKTPEVEDLESDADTVSDSEFDAFLNKTEVDGVDGKDDLLDIDFADGVTQACVDATKKKSKQQLDMEDDENADFDDDDLDMSGDSDDDDFGDEMMDEFEDESDMDDEDEDEDGESANGRNDGSMDDDDNYEMNDGFGNDELIMMSKLPTKKAKRGEKNNRGNDMSGLFAAAEDFTDIINESAKYDDMGVGNVSNKDRADPKQLKWEMKGEEDASYEKKKGRKGKIHQQPVMPKDKKGKRSLTASAKKQKLAANQKNKYKAKQEKQNARQQKQSERANVKNTGGKKSKNKRR